MESKLDALIVLSGGMDSTVALYRYAKYENVKAVNFYYGSKHNEQERIRAKKSCEKLNVELITIDLGFINNLFKSNLLQKGGDIPLGHYAHKTMKKTVVPFRNGIMLSVASGLAESLGASRVILGNHKGDHAVYPDCTDTFSLHMREAIKNGTYAEISLETPFVNNTKTEIASFGDQLNGDWNNSYSWYHGGEVHCGLGSTCYERREAFFDSNVHDPTQYIDKTPFEDLRKRYIEDLQTV